MTSILLKDALAKSMPKQLQTKVNFDRVWEETKKPEIPVSGYDEIPSSAELDKIAVDKPILPQSPNLYKQSGDFVQSEGFIKMPRSLLSDPEWQSLKLKQRHVFLTLLEEVQYTQKNYNVNFNPIVVMPGQLFVTLRALVEMCNKKVKNKDDKVDLAFVQRSVSIFMRVGWTIQEVIHGRTLFTITYPELYEHFKILGDTNFESNSIQTRYTNEERKERQERKGTTNDVESPPSYEMKKEKNTVPYQPTYASGGSLFDPTPDPELPKISEEQFKQDFFLVTAFVQAHKIPLKDQEIERWVKTKGGHVILSNLELMTRQKKTINNPGGWLERAIREDWAKLKKFEPVNRKFAEEFKKKHNWGDLKILQKYCTIEGASYDIPFNFPPETFTELLQEKFQNLYRGHSGEANY